MFYFVRRIGEVGMELIQQERIRFGLRSEIGFALIR
jgi:hypothetical protein